MEKDLEASNTEVKELRLKVIASLSDAESQTKRMNEYQTEIERMKLNEEKVSS